MRHSAPKVSIISNHCDRSPPFTASCFCFLPACCPSPGWTMRTSVQMSCRPCRNPRSRATPRARTRRCCHTKWPRLPCCPLLPWGLISTAPWDPRMACHPCHPKVHPGWLGPRVWGSWVQGMVLGNPWAVAVASGALWIRTPMRVEAQPFETVKVSYPWSSSCPYARSYQWCQISSADKLWCESSREPSVQDPPRPIKVATLAISHKRPLWMPWGGLGSRHILKHHTAMSTLKLTKRFMPSSLIDFQGRFVPCVTPSCTAVAGEAKRPSQATWPSENDPTGMSQSSRPLHWWIQLNTCHNTWCCDFFGVAMKLYIYIWNWWFFDSFFLRHAPATFSAWTPLKGCFTKSRLSLAFPGWQAASTARSWGTFFVAVCQAHQMSNEHRAKGKTWENWALSWMAVCSLTVA